MKLETGRISGGVWEAVVTAAEAPEIEALHGGRLVEGVEVQPVPAQPGRFALRVPIPAWVLNDGLQTILVQSGGQTVATVTLVAGQPLDGDIRVELSLLRAELDLLKRAFQRHVREG
jgi:hypothetical protein